MKLRVVGSGEAFDAGLGNNSFLLYGADVPTVLFDCGYQVPERLWAQRLHREIDAIYLTHTHADHVFGLVPLLSRYREERRLRPLVLIGHAGLPRYLRKLMDLGYPGMAARLNFVDFLALRPGRMLRWNSLALSCARSAHPVANLSVRVEGPGGRCLAVSGDGGLTPATAALYRGVDLLCHELYALRATERGHANLSTLEAFVRTSQVGRIVVSHHSRRLRSKIETAVERLSTTDPRWIVARPGLVLTL